MSNVIIAIAGPHGSGKSTVARKIASEFKLRYVSAGVVFRTYAAEHGFSLEELSKIVLEKPEIDREIDQRTKEEATKGNVVIDAQLAGWITQDNNDFSIFITAPFEVRCQRIATRENISLEQAIRETRVREESEAKRFKELYGVDIWDLSIYDLVINTQRVTAEETTQLVRSAIAEVVLPKKQTTTG